MCAPGDSEDRGPSSPAKALEGARFPRGETETGAQAPPAQLRSLSVRPGWKAARPPAPPRAPQSRRPGEDSRGRGGGALEPSGAQRRPGSCPEAAARVPALQPLLFLSFTTFTCKMGTMSASQDAEDRNSGCEDGAHSPGHARERPVNSDHGGVWGRRGHG